MYRPGPSFSVKTLRHIRYPHEITGSRPRSRPRFPAFRAEFRYGFELIELSEAINRLSGLVLVTSPRRVSTYDILVLGGPIWTPWSSIYLALAHTLAYTTRFLSFLLQLALNSCHLFYKCVYSNYEHFYLNKMHLYPWIRWLTPIGRRHI